MKHDLIIISRTVSKDHMPLFLSYRPKQNVGKIMQWLKGISSSVLLRYFPYLRKKFCDCQFWAKSYLATSSSNITDEMIKNYIDEQEGKQMANNKDFHID